MFNFYLKMQKQYVFLSGTKSGTGCITDIEQRGSILGYFIIFISDIV